MKKFKILNPILGAKSLKYQQAKEICQRTWLKKTDDDVFSFFYEGDYSEDNFFIDTLQLETADALSSSIFKTLDCFKYCLANFDFDYIYRSCLSTYINLPALKNFAETLPISNFYGGFVGRHRVADFAAGYGYWISKDLVKLLVTLREEKIIDKQLVIDDVDVGFHLREQGILPQPTIQQNKGGSIPWNIYKSYLTGDISLEVFLNNVPDCYCHRLKPADIPNPPEDYYITHLGKLMELINQKY